MAIMSKKVDPRIIRTQNLLRSALLVLISQKGYDAITVQDITEQATLNRSTFYLHYQDKEDLMQTMIKEVFVEIQDIPRQKPQQESNVTYIERLYTHLFQHVYQHQDFYKVIFQERSVASFTQQIQTHIEELGLKWMAVRRWEQVQIPPELFISFIGSGFMGMIRWWISNDYPYPPDYMAQKFMRLTLIGMHRDFGINPDDI